MKVFFLFIALSFLQAEKTLQDCDALIATGIEAMLNKEHAKSLELLTEAKALAQKNNWHKQEFLAVNNIGANYYSMLDYGEALNHYLEAYTIAIKELDENKEMVVLNNIAILYSKEKQYDKAEEYFKKAYDIAKQKGDTKKTGLYAVNLGILANEENNPQKAEGYLQEALSLLQGEPDILIQAQIALAQNYILRKEFDLARKIVLEVLPKLDTPVFEEQYIAALIVLSKVHEAQKETDEAIGFIMQGLKRSDHLESRITLHDRLALLYAKNNEFERAMQAKDSVFHINEALNQIKNGRLFETNKVKFEIENYQNELEDNQQRLLAERKTFYTLLSFAILIIFLISWALRNSFIKNKQRRIIDDRTKEIIALELEKEKSDNLLLEKQLQEKETLALLEQEKLKNEIEFKNRKLAVKALHLSTRNELIETIIESLSRQPEVSKNNMLANHVKQLKGHLRDEGEWESFLTHFEEVNQGFLASLKERHPSLSSNDIRFLSYMYMNLSTKEISLLLNITPEACRKRKERISKKMELKEHVDLYGYISTI